MTRPHEAQNGEGGEVWRRNGDECRMHGGKPRACWCVCSDALTVAILHLTSETTARNDKLPSLLELSGGASFWLHSSTVGCPGGTEGPAGEQHPGLSADPPAPTPR